MYLRTGVQFLFLAFFLAFLLAKDGCVRKDALKTGASEKIGIERQKKDRDAVADADAVDGADRSSATRQKIFVTPPHLKGGSDWHGHGADAP